MPGNEVGDRVQNLFDQGSLSQEQRHTQFVEGNWPVFNNNAWGANERQSGGALNSSSKNFSSQQSEIERGHQFTQALQGLNFTQSNLKPEFAKSPSQPQQLNLNGYMHRPPVVHARQNETNFLGMVSESDRNNMTSRGLSILESQQRSASLHSNSPSFRGSESPMNFNFLGGQQQMSGQQPGMLQLPRQQSGINDAQLLQQQQQVMLKQMQELQRRQQQYEAMQRSAMNQMSAFPNQQAVQHSPTINGSPMHDTSNYHWQSQVMAGNTNWQQRGHPSAVHGYSNGLMVTSEQGQAMRFMGLIPQQPSQSLYGVPVSNSGGANSLSQNSVDKPGGLHVPVHSSPFSANPYAPHVEQASMQDGSTVSRSGSEGRSSFEQISSQGLGAAGGFNRGHSRNVSMSEVGGQGFAGGSDVLSDKSVIQGTGSQGTSSQTAVGLDPTEEKILFGSDVNIWEAFGPATTAGNDGPDPFNGLPSMQSGTWSALMQSAVAETSSGDAGPQDEWCGLGSQNSWSQSGNQHPPNFQNNEKSAVWVDTSQRVSVSSQTSFNDVTTNNATSNTNYLNSSGLQQLFSNQRSLPMEGGNLQEGRRWLDSHQPHPHSETRAIEISNTSNLSKNDTSSYSHRQSKFLPESHPNPNVKMTTSLANSEADAAGPGLRNLNASYESSQRLPGNHSIDLWNSISSSVNSRLDSIGNDQHNMNKGQLLFGSSVDVPGGGAAKVHGTDNSDGRENSSDSQQNSFPNHGLAGSVKENVWSDAGNGRSLPQAQDMAGQGGKRPPGAPKFQYHPMGNDDTYGSQEHSHLQPMSQNLASGPKGHGVQQRFLSPVSSNLSDINKGPTSGFYGVGKMPHGVASSGVHAGYVPNAAVHFTRTGENASPNQHLTPSQNMLELLHKVDQSKDQNAVTNLSSNDYGGLPDNPAVGRVGPGQSQSSTSHGFNLQLAPPSQGIGSSLNDPAQSSSRMVDSPSSRFTASEEGDKIHIDGSQSNLKGNFSSQQLRNPFQNQYMLSTGRQVVGNQSSNISSDRHPYQDQQMTNYRDQATYNQSASNLHSNLASEKNSNQSGVRPSMHQSMPSQHAAMSGMRNDNVSQAGSYLFTSQHQLMAAQARNASGLHMSQFQSNNALDSSFSQRRAEPDSQRNRDGLSAQALVSVEESVEGEPQYSGKAAAASQEEPLVRQPRDASPSTSTASQQETDEFHHSLRPNSMAQPGYSLLHQMQAMKNAGLDPGNRVSKRFKGLDNGLETQQIAEKVAEPVTGGMNGIVGEPSVSRTSVTSGDAKMLSFSPQAGNRLTSTQFPQGAASPQDLLSFGRSEPQTFAGGILANRAQQMGISPQMAPSWFEQYGSFKNGQLLPVHSVPRLPMVKNLDQQLISGNLPTNSFIQNSVLSSKAVTHSGIGPNVHPPTEHVTSLHALVPDVPPPNPIPLRPKKRKTATSDLIPWNEEIRSGFKRLQNISLAEVDWAHSSNRLAEMAEDVIDTHEDLFPMARPRRRLILTTKLMQQVFCPPSASILSLDARRNYQVVVYSIARLALGDTCSLVCGMESDLGSDSAAPDSGSLVSVKAKTAGIRGQYFSKVVEDMMNRAKELENDLLRLDKRASILDFRLDCQDLERFSVINRFARFHGRGQVDGAETSTSSDASAMSHKPCLQRYVSAHPMPRTVPERVQCLSL